MKKQNGDARALGTRKAVLAAAVSLYAAMAGAQTNPALLAAPPDSSAELIVAQALPIDCPMFDTLGCKQEVDSLSTSVGIGVAAAAADGLGSTAAGGALGSDGSGTSSAGLGA